MGGPATLNDVHGFLLRLFSDSDLMKLPFQELIYTSDYDHNKAYRYIDFAV